MEDGRKKGGLARAASLAPERRSEIAQAAAAARWGGDRPAKKSVEYIYVIGPLDGPQKIGRSAEPLGRKLTFQTGNHLTLELSFQRPIDPTLASTAESLAHAILADSAIRGEWFDVSADEAAAAVRQGAARAEAGEQPRPASDESGSRVLSIRISPELHERFLAECERRGLKPAEFHRQAIEAIIDHMVDADLTDKPQSRSAEPRRLGSGIRGFSATDGSPILPDGPRVEIAPKAEKGKRK